MTFAKRFAVYLRKTNLLITKREAWVYSHFWLPLLAVSAVIAVRYHAQLKRGWQR